MGIIGTPRFMTDSGGARLDDAVYTAFGERIDGSPRRFGYAGAWGYQSTLDDQTPPAEVFPFLHVGARYYDPATGRFLQRDPIGVAGGLNVYAYVRNGPTIRIDPGGLIPIGGYPPYMPPPPPPQPKPKPPPPETPAEELRRIKRRLALFAAFYGACAAGTPPPFNAVFGVGAAAAAGGSVWY